MNNRAGIPGFPDIGEYLNPCNQSVTAIMTDHADTGYMEPCSHPSSFTVIGPENQYLELDHITQVEGSGTECESSDKAGLLHQRVPCWTLLVLCVVMIVFVCVTAGVVYIVTIKTTTDSSAGLSNSSPTIKQAPRSNCSLSWNTDNVTQIIIGQSMYILDKGDRKIWAKAQRFCLEHDSNLAAIETEKEWRALFPYLGRAHDRLWVGASNSVSKTGDLRWVFVDKPIVYHNYHVSRLSVNSTEPMCLVLDIYFGFKWQANPCSWEIGNSLCERPSS